MTPPPVEVVLQLVSSLSLVVVPAFSVSLGSPPSSRARVGLLVSDSTRGPSLVSDESDVSTIGLVSTRGRS